MLKSFDYRKRNCTKPNGYVHDLILDLPVENIFILPVHNSFIMENYCWIALPFWQYNRTIKTAVIQVGG